VTERQQRILAIRVELRRYLSAERRDKLLDELGRLVREEATGAPAEKEKTE
jgi:hypothetical protein